ncbi:MAG: ferrochelatase [Acidobacteria bacterium]|nr:ferrochelatase [Acidobacteriota bacterium]
MPHRLGVVLFQLGGPDTLEAIEPFLFNLFSDPDIIDFPFARLGRKPLARLIARARAKKVEHHYSVIGGGSPIRRHTEKQARLLETELRGRGVEAACAVAMRYWHPFTREALEKLEAAECSEYVLLPLYPQYSSTTTGSSLNEWARASAACLDGRRCRLVREFYTNPLYLDAMIERANRALDRFPSLGDVELVFSAHSLPLAVVEAGDPYQRQIESTVELLMARGAWPLRHRVCYQSKVGASKWLQPSLRSTIREMARAGVRDICVVPVSFVSDHVETLGEIDHEARELAAAAGIRQFEMAPGLNDSSLFIAGLAQLVMEAAGISAREETLIAAD